MQICENSSLTVFGLTVSPSLTVFELTVGTSPRDFVEKI
jgi:hypothetical protein